MDEQLAERPSTFLRVIGTLSVVNGVYGMLSSLLSAISPAAVDDQLLEQLLERLEGMRIPFEELRPDLETYFLNTMLQAVNISAASFLFYGMSLIGALMMLRSYKAGFWVYALAQLGLAWVPSFFGGFNTFGWTSFGIMLFWNGIWVVMYATQLKQMKGRA